MFTLLCDLTLASLSTFIALVVPGILLLKWILRIKTLSPLEELVIGWCLGLALFGLQAYLFGWMHWRAGGYLYLLLICVLTWHQRTLLHTWLIGIWRALRALPLGFLLLIVLGGTMQSVQMLGNGLPLAGTTRYWRTNAYDGIFHLGLIESMKTTFPPEEPSRSGLRMVNYHYWSDLIISEHSRLFGIQSSFLFFQWYPIWIALLTGLGVFLLVKQLTADQSSAFQWVAIVMSLLILYLGSDSGWIFPIWIHRIFTFSYPAIDNGPTQFLNVPHAFGKFFFFAVSLVFLHWRKTKQERLLGLGLFLSAVSFGIKVYFGIALSLGFGMVFVVDGIRMLTSTQQWSNKFSTLWPYFWMGTLFLVLFALIYLPANRNAGGLSWYPLEWPKLLINPEHFDWTTLNYRIAIASLTHDRIRTSIYDVALVGIGLVAIYGSRAVGFILTRKSLRILGADGVLFWYLPSLLFLGVGMTTLQVSGGFNVFNFFAVGMCAVVLTLALLVASLFERSRVAALVLGCLLIGVALPRSFFEVGSMMARYETGSDSVEITPSVQDAYAFLRSLSLPHIVIATSLSDPYESKSTYIRAFSGKPVYFSGKYLLETHNQPYQDREAALRSLYGLTDPQAVKAMASELGITHLWIDRTTVSTPWEKILVEQSQKALFANDRIVIYDIHTL